MTGPTFMLLGGYGNAGLQVARLMLAESDARVILAGRNLPAATAAAAALEPIVGGAFSCPPGYHVAGQMKGAR